MNTNQLKTIVQELRKYKGLTRKASLGEILEVFEETTYDDAGFLDVGDFKVVISCDSIEENLVKNDPRLAGYFSVLVNVNDVVAKGARPIGFLNVISSSSSKLRREIAEGMKAGLDKYGLRLIKGHTHPDSSYDAIDAAVVGVTKNVFLSSIAKMGDSLLIAVDLIGNFHSKGWVKTFDSTTKKSRQEIFDRLNSMIKIAERKLAHGAKDISGPGIIGTIAMLCESSQLGATVNLENIPKPAGVRFVDWLATYPGIGFIISTNQPGCCLDLFRNHGLSSAVIGKIIAEKKIWISYEGERELFSDLENESIFGITQ